jgi:hypothetical protein
MNEGRVSSGSIDARSPANRIYTLYALLCQVVFIEVIALKSQDMSDQQFPALCSHSDKAGMEPVGIGRIGNGVKPQYLDERFEEILVGETQRQREDLVGLVALVDRQTDASATDVDGFLGQLDFRGIGLWLNADGQGDGDAIELAAIRSGRLCSR